jgi:hypothetical protein
MDSTDTSFEASRNKSSVLIRCLFLGLIPLLFLQIPLRRITEPYPGILLPAGARSIRSEGHYVGYEKQYYAEDAAGTRHPVNIDEILTTVPGPYRPIVVEHGFGISKGRKIMRKNIQIAGRRLHLQLGRPLTPTQVQQTQSWVREQILKTSGIEAVRFHTDTWAVTTFYEEDPVRYERRLVESRGIDLVGNNH